VVNLSASGSIHARLGVAPVDNGLATRASVAIGAVTRVSLSQCHDLLAAGVLIDQQRAEHGLLAGGAVQTRVAVALVNADLTVEALVAGWTDASVVVDAVNASATIHAR